MRCSVGINGPKISASPKRFLVPWQSVPSVQDHTNIFSLSAHVIRLIEPHKAGNKSVDGIIATHADLWYRHSQFAKNNSRNHTRTNMLAWMELRTALTNDDISRYDGLIWYAGEAEALRIHSMS